MKLAITTLLFFTSAICKAQPPYERDFLESELNRIDLSEVLVSPAEWHPYPAYEDSAEWINLPVEFKKQILKKANHYLNHDWGQLSATLFLDYQRTGSRAGYADITYPRRIALNYLVYGELIERKGRFIDKIIDGIWVICEESTWDIPAHEFGHKGRTFPDPEDPLVALMSAETGALLAWTDYLIGNKLDEVSPAIGERIYYEVQRRILTPALEESDAFWMGFEKKWVNNWNPWVNSNWLTANLLLERDPDRRRAAFKKSLLSLDHFINMYGPDGGCDEGPGYYGHAAASMFECLETIISATHSEINIFDHPQINAMGDYIRKVHIDGKYHVNFADAAAKIMPQALIIYRFGHAVQNEALTSYALYFLNEYGFRRDCLPGKLQNLGRTLPNIFTYQKTNGLSRDYKKSNEAWLADIQVACLRSTNKEKELFLAAKGGHNAESHNHNDVGSFILYADGKPVIIDIGVEQYTKKTFSSERYTIWTMQSQYHNLPTINGVMQKNGAEYKAKKVDFSSRKSQAVLKMDISGAYPESAKVNDWQRKYTFKKKQGKLILEDLYDVQNESGITWNFMAYATISEPQKGHLLLRSKDGNQANINLIYNPEIFELKIEDCPIDDSNLAKVWKSSLTRVQFIPKEKIHQGRAVFEFY